MSMMAQLARIERRSLEIENLLSRPEISANPREYRKLSIEHAELSEAVELFRTFSKLQAEIDDVSRLVTEATGDMLEFAQDELDSLLGRRAELEADIALKLLPKDPNDSRNVLLEIRAGAGGDEASLFAGQLFRMYSRFCERRRWRVELMSLHDTELGGIKEVVILVEGENVYRTLKFESGVHRVQRVPATEAQGRIHTSTVTVAILPEAEDVEVTINEGDLRIDTYRASGAGGQHVNRTDSAVRITHLPSGVVVACQDERSQIKNRAKAMKILQAKLLEQAQIEQDKAHSEERKLQVGRGDRSERIRTYNFPQSRLTDHRINLTTHALSDFMDGDLMSVLDALQMQHQTELLRKQAAGGQ